MDKNHYHSGLFALFFLLFVTTHVSAAKIEYEIAFTQTYFHPNFGSRPLQGSFFVDDSILGAGHENKSHGPFSSEMSALSNFTVTLSGSTIYNFDLAFTQDIVAPPISSVIMTGAAAN